MKALNNSKGTILVATLATMLLASLFITAAFRYTDLSQNLIDNHKNKKTYNTAISKLRSFIADRSVFYDSMGDPANPEFRNCLVDDSAFDGNTADDCVADTYMPVTPSRLLPDGSRQILAGRNASSAVMYSWDGKLCGLPDVDCTNQNFTVISDFKARCASGATSCRLAHFLTFRLLVTPYDGSGVAPFEITRTMWLDPANEWSAVVREGRVTPPVLPTVEVPGGDTNPGPVDDSVNPAPPPSQPPSCPGGQASKGGSCHWFSI